jgi:hypothetical protein
MLLHHRVEIAVVKLNNAGIFRPLPLICLLVLYRPTEFHDEGFETNIIGRKKREREKLWNK